MHWRDRIAAHMQDREVLDLKELYSLFAAAGEEDQRALDECFSVFEEEYDVQRGLLRPDDPLALYLEPPKAKGFFAWLFGRAAIEDKGSELSYVLKRRRMKIGRKPVPEQPPATVGDYANLWLGRS